MSETQDQVTSNSNAARSAPEPVACAAHSQRLLELARRVAASDCTVLICGESGTGKEVLSRYVHRRSQRAKGPFVAVNCAAIPENMLEAMLFGYERGSFTGAHSAHPGKFEQAQGGTLLLDEVTEMPLGLQAKLLRVLQEKEVERLGCRAPLSLDVRVIATTNRRLREEVAAGRFREDLYYRLNVVPIVLPALRERPDDIRHLIRHFLFQLNERHQRSVRLAPAGMNSLAAYPWPGNIRQLYNVLERIVVLCEADLADEALVDGALISEVQGQVLEAVPARDARRTGATLADMHAAAAGGQSDAGSTIRPYHAVMQDEREAIAEAIRRTGGNKSQAARVLGLTLRQLNYRLARFGMAGSLTKR